MDAPDAPELPIRNFAKQIVEAVRSNPVTVVIGETGSGKTTQISQILEEAGFAESGRIGITQPRRVAAVTVARRVAEERRSELGREVGYAVRFEERCSQHTRIKYLTDGTLLRECLDDPELSQYSVIVLDEAHERSLNTDILFGVLKGLVKKRVKPLRLIITSATLDGEKFSAYFDDCPVFNVPGRCFPVKVVHSQEDHTKNYLQAAIDTVMDIHTQQPEGDILVFLTGQAEIERAVAKLNQEVANLPPDSCMDMMVFPLYAALPPEMQARVFARAPEGCRRVIVATNIAETSITVDGVVYVVDPGMVKEKSYNPQTGMDSLAVTPISRVQATQRAGRAGRTRPGMCFRLYTAAFYERDMPTVTVPEIQRTSLLNAVLHLKSLPLDVDVLGFDYLDKPATAALEDALRQLYVLDAIDREGVITGRGRAMAGLPLDPALARALLAAADLHTLPDMVTVAAMLSADSVFYGGRGPEQLARGEEQQAGGSGRQAGRGGGQQALSEAGRAALQQAMAEGLGDHIMLLRLYQAWERAGFSMPWCKEVGLDVRGMRFARDVRRQLEGIVNPDGPAAAQSRSGGAPSTSGRGDGRNGAFSGRDGWRPNGPLAGRKRSYEATSSGSTDALRKSLLIGFANRLAHRMSRHNGYKTLGDKPTLALPHPATARMDADDDGLLPEWVIYHELVATSKVFLSRVCPMEKAWVAALLPKLQQVDVKRLSGGATTAIAVAVAEGAKQETPEQAEAVAANVLARRNDVSSVDAAKARFLARKAAKQR